MLKLRINITEIYWKHIRCFNEIFFYLSSNPNAITLLEKIKIKLIVRCYQIIKMQ